MRDAPNRLLESCRQTLVADCGVVQSPIMRISWFDLTQLLVLAVVFESGACGAQERCAGEAVTEVRSLSKLPSDLRRLLPIHTRGLDGIADRGGRFNVTDVVDEDLPMHRFTLAAIGKSCAVVAIEYGGRAHGFQLTEYRLAISGWRSVGKNSVFNEPISVTDLLTLR